ncbi:hypothetical protein MCHIJ_32490 [Mycolicibacterium chitae]|nr:hypothetical protein MCHIJ_32490 [Mycolicibacterium chitae]
MLCEQLGSGQRGFVLSGGVHSSPFPGRVSGGSNLGDGADDTPLPPPPAGRVSGVSDHRGLRGLLASLWLLGIWGWGSVRPAGPPPLLLLPRPELGC